MKDITHYFSDLSKSGGNASAPLEEVKVERAKIDDPSILEKEESRAKKKRGRVKIKISRKSKEGTVCDILESSDLVDKTPSPYPQSNKRITVPDNETPKRKTHVNHVNSESGSKNVPIKAKRRVKNNVDSEFKTHASNINGSSQSKDQTDCMKMTKEKKKCNDTKEDSSTKKTKTKKEKEEKLIELANKKGYSKRKLVEEEEAAKIEKRLEKRKKLFTTEPNNKDTKSNKGNENMPKDSEVSNGKRTGNLFNYFSKATPEQLKKERLIKTKVIVKAEIHTPDGSTTCPSDTFNKINKDLLKKNNNSKLKQTQDKFDEILLIQSETLTDIPSSEKFQTSPQKYSEKLQTSPEKHKPKWSLKIQFQPNGNILSGIADDDEMYTPTAAGKSQKENIKYNKKIPRILLPIKNKKSDLCNGISDMESSNKKEERKNVSIDNIDNLKTDNIKTDVYKMLNSDSTVDVHKVNGISSKDDDECLIIEENSLKRKSQEKLAPLFTKKIKPSPEVVAARRLFLQSDIQENGHGNTTRKLMPLGPTSLPFPKFSHINQLSSNVSTLEKALSFTLKHNSVSKACIDAAQMKSILKFETLMPYSESLFTSTNVDIETAVSAIESYYPDARNLWKPISQISKHESCKKSQKSRRRASDKKNVKKSIEDTSNELLNFPWTDKYKPKNSTEIVGNEKAVSDLRSWLENWKSLRTEDYSSGDEFYTSDCSMSSNIENNQVAVLVGPHGSGKSASVYAIAEELGYKVIEVNASSKRPGKKILKDFEEATKSHRVKKSHLKNILIPVSKKLEETKKISQNSLILMEDIDLIFEEDEGFISAAFQLASNTKRPIVMTLRDRCSYLPKMASQQFRIEFQEACDKKVLALLQLITLAETNSTLSQSCIDALYQNGDLRRALLQLQYLLLSGKNKISLNTFIISNSSWKNMQTYIYKPAIKIEKSNKKKEMHRYKNNEVLDDLVNDIDSFALVSKLMKIEDPTSLLSDLKMEPSISFFENETMYSSLDSISSEIGEWLSNRIYKSVALDVKTKKIQTIKSDSQVLTKKQINTGVDYALSQITSNILDKRALALDYLSNIRTICRAEEIRNQQNSKRGNRFFHYFQSSLLGHGVTKSNILSAACKMLQDKATVNADT